MMAKDTEITTDKANAVASIGVKTPEIAKKSSLKT